MGAQSTAKVLHEMVHHLPKLFQSLFLKNRLVLIFQGWEDTVTNAYLTYTKTDGSAGRNQF